MRALKLIVVGLLVATAVTIGTFVYQSAVSSARSPGEPRAPGARGLVPQSAPRFNEVPRGDVGRAPASDDGAVGEIDGALPDGAAARDVEYPGIANLDPKLLRALSDASEAAADDDIQLWIKSGWRSRSYQDQLLRDAVSEYGSEKEAARWVATADTSPHVSGDAVDIGSAEGMAWLSDHGAAFGLCQIYRNEPWHYELRPAAVDGRCPPMYTDPTHDPRMHG